MKQNTDLKLHLANIHNVALRESKEHNTFWNETRSSKNYGMEKERAQLHWHQVALYSEKLSVEVFYNNCNYSVVMITVIV